MSVKNNEDLDKAIACTIRTSTWLANIEGMEGVKVSDIVDAIRKKFPEVADNDITNIAIQNQYEVIKLDGEIYIRA